MSKIRNMVKVIENLYQFVFSKNLESWNAECSIFYYLRWSNDYFYHSRVQRWPSLYSFFQMRSLQTIRGSFHTRLGRSIALSLLGPTVEVPICPFYALCSFPACLQGLTRAWPGGGGRLTPPPSRIFAIAQKRTALSTWNLAGLLIQQFDIVRRNVFLNPSENFWDMVDFVTSLHATFGRKLAKLRGSVEDAVFNENANGKHQKT